MDIHWEEDSHLLWSFTSRQKDTHSHKANKQRRERSYMLFNKTKFSVTKFVTNGFQKQFVLASSLTHLSARPLIIAINKINKKTPVHIKLYYLITTSSLLLLPELEFFLFFFWLILDSRVILIHIYIYIVLLLM